MYAERARPEDLPAVEHLLRASGLPLDGADAAFRTGVVVSSDGRIVGAAAIEPYGEAGLLRSVVVASDQRNTGIGGLLVESAETLARDLAIDQLFLLTDTAEDWFSRRGYVAVDRADVPAKLRASIEFTTACAETAVAMKRRLGS